jgi:hypothetical protein
MRAACGRCVVFIRVCVLCLPVVPAGGFVVVLVGASGGVLFDCVLTGAGILYLCHLRGKYGCLCVTERVFLYYLIPEGLKSKKLRKDGILTVGRSAFYPFK